MAATSSSRWPRSPSHGKCSKRFCGSSRSYGHSHHQRQHEAFDCHAFKSNRQEKCVQMPVKIARSVCSTIVRAARAAGSHPRLASVLQQGRKSANICVSLGVIRAIPAQYASVEERSLQIRRERDQLIERSAKLLQVGPYVRKYVTPLCTRVAYGTAYLFEWLVIVSGCRIAGEKDKSFGSGDDRALAPWHQTAAFELLMSHELQFSPPRFVASWKPEVGRLAI